MRMLFKVTTVTDWALAERAGVFEGSGVDHKDGFIHLSAADQVRETAARHFAEQHDLVLVAFGEDFLENLKWEPSRGGQLFPHVHGTIPVAAAAWVRPLPFVDGVHQFPDEVAT